MPVATTAIIAGGTALAGMGMNIGQAVKANKQAKAAGQAAAAASQQMKNIKEQNMFAQVQVPTLGFEMAQQGIDRSTQAALGAVQGAGAEGVIGGVGQIMGATGEAEMGLAAQAGEAKLQRDMAQATAGANIEMRRGERESAMYQAELTGAQAAKTAAENAKTEAISGAVGSLGSAAGSFGGLIGAGYGKSAPLMTNTGATPTVPTQAQAAANNPALSPYGLVGNNQYLTNYIP
jgi:type II secretory pathway pseudopilin PulG